MHSGIERSQLRSFAFVVGCGFAIIGLWPLIFRARPLRMWAVGIALVVALLGLLAPALLKPVYRGWMILGHALGWVNSHIILGVLFFTIFTIGALLMRLFKVDPMRRGFDPKLSSYRIPRNPRPAAHLKQQF
ncbi:MAG: hypothetical protein FJW26_20820 [Acidimicrobiia bacterium]|nr:hypothetical protein [Acidimicrobiia bacterium]